MERRNWRFREATLPSASFLYPPPPHPEIYEQLERDRSVGFIFLNPALHFSLHLVILLHYTYLYIMIISLRSFIYVCLQHRNGSHNLALNNIHCIKKQRNRTRSKVFFFPFTETRNLRNVEQYSARCGREK